MLSFSYKPEIGDLISATQAVILRASTAAAAARVFAIPSSGSATAASPGRVSKFVVRLGIKHCCLAGLILGGIAQPPRSSAFIWLMASTWLFSGLWLVRFGLWLRSKPFVADAFVASEEFREVFELPSTTRAFESFKPVTINMDAVRIVVVSEDGQYVALWTGFSRIVQQSDCIRIESHRRTGDLIVIPTRALPQGTDVELLISVFEQLRRGERVAGM